ncbi:polysaccharide deacetylase family protein [Rossellomorea vietnamensis]|uniref:Polysaccharide deacetylase family protein n=1 Tax=Rossellomorea vietnamensis TaxID=218284 RepID=A0ACD4CB97_9BACI|nr:polysaccharide deacetylase family protein [Rossellomorea vietnamensis]UXH45566.1 polysaccharide deacetylase family protein [Rossellomorea vietnamensis]
MKKILASGLTLLLLTACGSEQTGSSPEAEKSNQTEVKEVDQKQSEGPETEVSESETKEKEEPAEEVVLTKDYKINEANWSIEPVDKANPKVVLLTIDDAPDQHALQMAEDLKELKAPAIFFVNGHFLDTPEEKETLKKIHDLGFMIGNHTYSHSSLKDLSPEEQKEEIVSVSDLVESITGERPQFFRAPFGQNTDYSRKLAAEEKMSLMNWTYGYDWEKQYQTKAAITDIMINSPYLNDGANLLMHDRTWTSEALKDIVNGLRSKGYETLDPHRIKTIE